MQDRTPPPVPFPLPAAPGIGYVSPARIATALARLLAQHGITGTYAAACDLYAVISVTPT